MPLLSFVSEFTGILSASQDADPYVSGLTPNNVGTTCQTTQPTSISTTFYGNVVYEGTAVEVANGIQIAWQTSDLATFSPVNAPLSQVSAASSIALSTQPNSLTMSSSSSQTSSAAAATSTKPPGGLSTGAKAGIGVGVGLGVVALVLVGVSLFLRRQRKARATGQTGQTGQEKAELSGEAADRHRPSEVGAGGEIAEMTGASKPAEADSNHRGPVAELEGSWYGHEAPHDVMSPSGHVPPR